MFRLALPLFVLLASTSIAQDRMSVSFNGSPPAQYHIDAISKVTFRSDTMIVGGVNVFHNLTDIQKIVFAQTPVVIKSLYDPNQKPKIDRNGVGYRIHGGLLTINSNKGNIRSAGWIMTDVKGRVVKRIYQAFGQTEAACDISSLISGIYLVRLLSDYSTDVITISISK